MEVTVLYTGEFRQIRSPNVVNLKRWVGTSAGGIPMELWVAEFGPLDHRNDERRYVQELNRDYPKLKVVMNPEDKVKTDDSITARETEENQNGEVEVADNRQPDGIFFTG